MKDLCCKLLLLATLVTLTACKISPNPDPEKSSSNVEGDACIPSTTNKTGTITTKISGSTSAPYGFVQYVPSDYATSGKNYPVIVFLHGLGEQGTDNATNLEAKMSYHGPIKRIKQGRHFPALVFAPQSPGWWNSATLKTFLQYIENNFRVDKTRVYLTGLSMGGGGTWDYMRHDPSRIAGAIPVCGASGANNSASERAALKAVPHLSVHNIDDGTVTYGNSQGFANSLGALLGSRNQVLAGYVAGSNVTMHFSEAGAEWEKHSGSLQIKDDQGEYSSSYIYAFDANGGHDAWTKTYASEDTWNWLFCQKKP